MGFKRKRGGLKQKKGRNASWLRGKERRIVVFRKVRLVQEASAAGGNYYVSPPPPLAHPPSPIPHPPPPHTPAFLQTLSNALAQVKHDENSYPSPFPHREKKKKKKKTKKRERNYRLFMILLSRNEKTKKQQKEKQLLNIASSPSCSEAETRRDSSHACSLMNLMRLSVDVKIITRPFLPLRVI